MIQRYYWPPIPLNGDTSKSKCYVKEADLIASLRRVREKVGNAHIYSDTEDADGVFDMLGKNEILAIIDEAIKEAGA